MTYESVKRSLRYFLPQAYESSPLVLIAAATLGEISACSVRVPAEVLKQRMQVMHYKDSLRKAALHLYRTEGSLGFYRGFQATIQREIPFACLQYPLYEYFKGASRAQPGESWKGALCGSLAGGISGFLTTPLDVVKTRVMLAQQAQRLRPWEALRLLWQEGGLLRIFAGAAPRTAWISVGGFLFFGAYEKANAVLARVTKAPPSPP